LDLGTQEFFFSPIMAMPLAAEAVTEMDALAARLCNAASRLNAASKHTDLIRDFPFG